jgi:hypothetical protein
MAEEPAYIRKLRAITRAEPHIMQADALDRELYNSGSDRATVVMFGALVETHLERLLISKMRDDLNSKDKRQLFEYEGALGTFSAKIIVAYALKLIGPISRFDLDLVRFLRNEFAHSRVPFDFKTPEVRVVCEQLKIVDLSDNPMPYGYVVRDPHEGLKVATDRSDTKVRFISTCHNLSYRMIMAKDGPKAGDIVFPGDNPVP